MEFAVWGPIYQEILDDFEFNRKDDERSAIILSDLLSGLPNVDDISVLRRVIEGKDVLVCGNALTLADDLGAFVLENYIVIAADGATEVLMNIGIVPDIIVTDLDGNVEKEICANQKGSFMVVHAHGDNTDKLKKYVPRLNGVIGTTQSNPLYNVYNFGGFTDGDRSVYLAREFNAAYIELAGFDFDDNNVSEIKRKKLKWANWLINQVL
ncbi:MAG: 6-hydroxymethylpterin diphosphokinase MptE-like protein [Methanohalobium sp.]|uniref:6-hydroxymethylpterin diphosphokinase MptE-like protein n=1 Tax=Methanohalobium sp. TaxID=2837493 RepID=UPI00397E303F